MRILKLPILATLFALSAGTICQSSAAESSVVPQATKPETRKVRVVYLVPSDKKEDPRYTAAIGHAIKDLQVWYGKHLGGPTFHLSEPVVEVVQSEKDAKWFAENPNGGRRDDWQFNNTLEEAQKLRGSRFDDPKFIWVIYVDSPGNTGRGGNGVTCLPEDDLLGLVGEHPTQKSKDRWIAGLGHELGHAFGLPHPDDTTKDADALMWAGFYTKYRTTAYLTPEDKEKLLKSPFFYHPDGKPVAEEAAAPKKGE
jgi:hypothetical protein